MLDGTRTPPSPWIGSVRIGAGFGPVALLIAPRDAEGDLMERFSRRTEALEIFRLAAGGHRCEGTPMEGAFEGEDPVALGGAVHRLELACCLDRTFHRLGAGIAKEGIVRKTCRAQP